MVGAAGWFGYRQMQTVAVVSPIVLGEAIQAVPANILVTEAFRMEIKSESGGRILKSHVQLGTEVKAGDVLFEIDPRDLELETLAGVLRGEILVHNHCYRADEMAQMIDIAKEFGYEIRSFHHGVEAYKIRDLLAREGIAGSL